MKPATQSFLSLLQVKSLVEISLGPGSCRTAVGSGSWRMAVFISRAGLLGESVFSAVLFPGNVVFLALWRLSLDGDKCFLFHGLRGFIITFNAFGAKFAFL